MDLPHGRRRGASSVEYAILVSLIAVVIFGASPFLEPTWQQFPPKL